ncbi:MAG TPA: glycosyltransferase [Chitinophagaceae bacterium]|nr:glycosyltransferase [Chitinophagaceae bacterium]
MNTSFILWLPSWYPNKLEPFEGDFIQRHAEAASQFNDIYVIKLVADPKGIGTKSTSIEVVTRHQLTEQIIYFKKSSSLFGRMVGAIRGMRLYRRAIKKLIEKQGKPLLVHVHVTMKAGLLALWLKRKYGLKFLVTEHFGIYNDTVKGKFSERNIFFRKFTKKIIYESSLFLSVSKFLGEQVNRLILKKKYVVIPNVVNTAFFYNKASDNIKCRFIHVSNMVPLKNVEGILEAAALLKKTNGNFEIIFVGNKDDSKRVYAEDLGLDNVFFKGEIPYNQVAKEMQRSDVFILFSDMENAPCVITESLCCGTPVIATMVGGVPELVNEKNGILIEPRNVVGLANAMKKMMNDHPAYDREKIAEEAKARFNYKLIGKMIADVYDSSLANLNLKD